MTTDRRPPFLFLTGSYALLNIYATQPLLTSIAQEYGEPPAQASWTITATTLAIALSAPLAGSLSDRLGRKRVMVPAMLSLAVVTLLCAVAPNLASLLVLRFLQGACIPFVFAVAVAYIDDEWERPDSARINALYVSGSVLGGFCGRFLSGIAASVAGWRAAFVTLAVVGLLLSCAVALWLPKEKHFEPQSSLLSSLRGMRQHFVNVPLLATCLVGGTLLFAQVASFTYASLHLAAPPFSLPSAAVGAVFAVFLVGVVVTPWTGRAILRFGRMRTFAVAVSLCWFGLVLCAVPSTLSVVCGLACCSTGVFAGQVCATGYAALAAGRAKSSGVGLYLTCYYLGGSLGAVVPAGVYRHSGFVGCLLEIAAVLLVSLLASYCAWPTERGGSAYSNAPARRGC